MGKTCFAPACIHVSVYALLGRDPFYMSSSLGKASFLLGAEVSEIWVYNFIRDQR